MVAIILLFIVLAWRNRNPAARLAAIAIITVVALWFSFPSAIMFGGLSLMLLPALWRRGWRGIVQIILCNAAVGASFLVLYFKSIKPQHVAYLSDFWTPDFPDYGDPFESRSGLDRNYYRSGDHPYRSFGLLLAAAGRRGRHRSVSLRPGASLLAACLLPLGACDFRRLREAISVQWPTHRPLSPTLVIPALRRRIVASEGPAAPAAHAMANGVDGHRFRSSPVAAWPRQDISSLFRGHFGNPAGGRLSRAFIASRESRCI